MDSDDDMEEVVEGTEKADKRICVVFCVFVTYFPVNSPHNIP